ncbi:hypothetical protein EHI8A_084310 [Entamoeba histolytica HM-1:IMSS-B]|uniref:Uncharacterized protein n=6 Tax=Entamoeba histolytica TaxID=5759 RepID=C4LVH3_ENTH1|nr:hypothetical protein EHI_103280 [Entamoeba histolytica HM-1:IMSS]EMD44882.1 Hypothetical protein EHI5A_124140 [Entamoeba histolytica KU27]EMH74306.1 hypothetical protein EHI8A_084310 [Entamoeba histolytica HM-1:IMSS-B]EMS17363.1 hypothetical protein KM1_152060 [Entamoeba histolytica HM-3:IMSS]ENY59796.1 hypothetical protein EHI7A_082500 [Entamoeba histolytica HM-1:IMSS-A]GAT92667.1 hypothetical protein CL6EHI_103280 [Entamoeba histolytica]|eukprot:XP_652435.1 hypothetical protein EHI_103280 [Entamoeba histolytica HM-1:IMSS]
MEIEPSIEQCSLHRVKRIVIDCIKEDTTGNTKNIQTFWSLLKQTLIEQRLVYDDTKEVIRTSNEEKQLRDLQMRAEENRKKIEEMVISLTKKIQNTKQIEQRVGTEEITQQDAMMLEEALEMVKQMNEMNKKSLNELKKIETVKALGEKVRRDSCSLIPKDNLMEIN